MLAFITYVIKLIIKLIFVDEIVKEKEELKQKVQRIEQEKEEIAQSKQQSEERNQLLIQQNFNLVQKYIAVNKQKEKVLEELARSNSTQSAQPFNHYRSAAGLNYSNYLTTNPNQLDINQEFDPEDFTVIDELIREFSPSEELTI